MPYQLLIGPVLGKISKNNKVPILIECESSNSHEQITLCVYSDGQEQTYMFDYSSEPMLLYIDLLNNTSIHTIKFKNVCVIDNYAECKFNPINTGTAIISCDGDGMYHYDTGIKSHAWNSLNNSDITNAIHIGDQVYIDDVYNSTRITADSSDTEMRTIFTDEIKSVYHSSWFVCKSKQQFLANHLNIMIIDDHDVYDNFTSIDFEMNKYDRKMKIFLDVASKLAAIYQIGLSQSDVHISDYTDLRNISKVTTLESIHTKFIIVNSRLTKSYSHMFGDDILEQIELEANNSNHKKIVLVDQVSPFIVSNCITNMKFLFSMSGIDITDHVTYNQQWIKDYKRLFDIMFNIEKTKTIAYVTGDLHVGQEHTLFRSCDGREMHCMTSSPLSSNVGLKNFGYIAHCIFNLTAQSYNGYTYINKFVYANNYVIIHDRYNCLCASNSKDEPFENIVARFPNK